MQHGGGGRMVAMGMGAADRHHRGIANRGHERPQMAGLVWPGIDHGNAIAPTNKIGLRAGEGEGRGVAGEHAANQRCDRLGIASRPWLGRKSHTRTMEACAALRKGESASGPMTCLITQ